MRYMIDFSNLNIPMGKAYILCVKRRLDGSNISKVSSFEVEIGKSIKEVN